MVNLMAHPAPAALRPFAGHETAPADLIFASSQADLRGRPHEVWDLLSRPAGIARWMSDHHAWHGRVPDRVDAGDELEAQIRMFDMIQDVRLLVTECVPQRMLSMVGVGSVGIVLTYRADLAPRDTGTHLTLEIGLGGPVLRDVDVTVLGAAVTRGLDHRVQHLMAVAA